MIQSTHPITTTPYLPHICCSIKETAISAFHIAYISHFLTTVLSFAVLVIVFEGGLLAPCYGLFTHSTRYNSYSERAYVGKP